MTNAIRDFIAEADAGDLLAAFAAAGGGNLARTGTEWAGPCPLCGGTDRFSISPSKGKWNCRGAGGGSSPVGMVAHVTGLDPRRAQDLIAAAEIVLGRDRPGETETREERAEREKASRQRIEEARRKAEREERRQDEWREAERRKARGIWSAACASGRAEVYLAARLGLGGDGAVGWPLQVRSAGNLTYWHGQDDAGRPAAIHSGPAMVAAFVADPLAPFDGENVIGCHLTWIDLAAPPKFRPALRDGGQDLPTKKMRGSKKGGIIPVLGDPRAETWLGGEGIENGLGLWLRLGAAAGVFVFAAGDLGNLAGPAASTGRLKRPDGGGFVPSPRPAEDAGEGAAMPVPEHVRGIVLAGDADSDPAATAAMMLRAKARMERPGRRVAIAWPQTGMDFADMARKGM